MKKHQNPILLILILLLSCNQEKQNKRLLFELLDSESTGITYRNDLKYTESINPYTFRNFYNGAGVALGDINNDGLLDIFFASNQQSNRLYLNSGGLKFEDITDKAGLNSLGVWSTGVSMVDINQDGLLDIYVCKSGPAGGVKRKNELFINQGDLAFSEEAEAYGLAEEGLSQHAVFFDYDFDGDLDMYLLSNSGRSVGIYDLREGQREIRDPEGGNKLFKNEGQKFIDVSEEAGIYGSSIGYGLGVTVADLNDDLWPDLYVSNDFFERDYIYFNNQDGTFSENLEGVLSEISLGSMGADIADLNNDALPEIFVTEMLPSDMARVKTKTPFEEWDKYTANIEAGYHHQFTRNTLQRNLGKQPNSTLPIFSEISRLTGTEATDWSWGALIFDADNDGLKDIFVANGIVKDLTDFDFVDFYVNNTSQIAEFKEDSVLVTKMIDEFPSNPLSNYLFKNEGNFGFSNMAEKAGLDRLTFSTGSAYGDLDNDGDLDLVVNNQNDFSFVYQNTSTEQGLGNYLKVDLGRAFGAKVFCYVGEQILFQEFQPVKGYLSSVDPILHFGLGDYSEIDSVTISWPNGQTSLLKNIATNQTLVPNPNKSFLKTEAPKTTAPYFSESIQQVPFSHSESDFIDFDSHRTRFWMISNEGPRVAQSDINSDGLTDIFIPGAKGHSAQLWLQQKSGDFKLDQSSIFEERNASEQVTAHFFDANGDTFPDLIVGNGGIEYGNFNPNYKDQLFLNDGMGNFEIANSSFSSKPTSFILNYDLDTDGDEDLIIGSRGIPFDYGLPGSLEFWINDGEGNFSNQSAKLLPGADKIGLITTGALADLDQDGITELIIAGEWMPIRIFSLGKDEISERTTEYGFENSSGLWQSLYVGDVNSDGIPDIFGGNWGLNTRLRTSKEEPLQLIINDFDQNGSLDPILVSRHNGEAIPWVMKNTLLKQIPSLRKQLPTYASYQNRSLEELFPPSILSNSLSLEIETLASTLWINTGSGSFSKAEIPKEIQSSPIFAITTLEGANSNFPKIILGGNQSKVKPELGSQMGSFGWVMETKDGKSWAYPLPEESGFFVKGEIRDLIKMTIAGETKLIVLRNNENAIAFDIQK